VAGSVPVVVAAAVFVVAAGAAGLAPGFPWWRGVLAVAAGYFVAGVLLARCVRRLGGITGDVLGACVEVGAAAALVTLGS
jgi:adenosylcobinamide-GDP ribazoletransferase